MWGFISSTIMFTSCFLCSILLALKHTHFIPDSYVFHLNALVPALLLSTYILFRQLVQISYFTQPTGNRSWQSFGKNGCPFPTKMQAISHVHFFFPHKAVPQIHESKFVFSTQLLHHHVDCHPPRFFLSLAPASNHW